MKLGFLQDLLKNLTKKITNYNANINNYTINI